MYRSSSNVIPAITPAGNLPAHWRGCANRRKAGIHKWILPLKYLYSRLQGNDNISFVLLVVYL